MARALLRHELDGTRIGLDTNAETMRAAIAAGVIGRAARDMSELADCDLIVVATPVRATPGLMVELSKTSTAVLMELSSVKGNLLPILSQCVEPSRVVLSHPMAGSEHAGFAHSRPNLFAGKTWLVCRHAGLSRAASEMARELISACGAFPVEIDAREHDAMVAQTSHLPQILSTVFAAWLLQKSKTTVALPSACGTGARSMTRLAGSPYELWRDILEVNREEVRRAVREFSQEIQNLLDAMERDRGEEWFAKAQEFYRTLREVHE